MTVKLIETKKDSKDWKKIKALYLRAFPAVERLPFWLLKKKTQRRIAEFCSLYDDDEWVGFIYTLKNDSLAYVFFLAIDDTKRSHGYGSKLIRLKTTSRESGDRSSINATIFFIRDTTALKKATKNSTFSHIRDEKSIQTSIRKSCMSVSVCSSVLSCQSK